ncbi:hypothetical protein ACFQ0O_00400 [Saccharopolyspora spinosporotrichia]
MAEEKDEDSKDKRKERKLDLSAANVCGTALASVTAAYLGSYLGAVGTMWGAALTSVVVTVGGKLYQRSLERTKEQAAAAKEKAALLRAKKTTAFAQQSLRFDAEGRTAPPSSSSPRRRTVPSSAPASSSRSRRGIRGCTGRAASRWWRTRTRLGRSAPLSRPTTRPATWAACRLRAPPTKPRR